MFDFFEKIISYFETYNIPYMLSGSIAMGLYIVPRATRDIDFVVHLQLSDLDGVINHFGDEYYLSRDAIRIQEWQAAVQMEDIKSLYLRKNLDLDYIKFWISELKLKTFNLLI